MLKLGKFKTAIAAVFALVIVVAASSYAKDAEIKPDYTVRFDFFAIQPKSKNKPVTKATVPTLFPEEGVPMVIDPGIRTLGKQMSELSKDYHYRFIIRVDANVNQGMDIYVKAGPFPMFKEKVDCDGTIFLKKVEDDVATVEFRDININYPKLTSRGKEKFNLSTERKMTLGRTYAIGGVSDKENIQFVMVASVHRTPKTK